MPRDFLAAPGAALRLACEEPLLLAIAGKLWNPGGDGAIPFRVRVFNGDEPAALAERAMAWTVEGGRLRCLIPGALGAVIDSGRGCLAGCVSRSLLARDPALVARALLEAPVAALLTFRLAALHAAAVVGARGAAVIRGPAGAGKSTLAAECHKAGLRVMADESLLVDPAEPDILHATVRDLTLREDSPALEGLETTAAFSGGEPKRRVDLFSDAHPGDRTAHRVATLLLGPRTPGPARLVPLDGPSFLAEFPAGAVPQETWGAGANRIAADWAGRETFRLEGHEDLAGAVACVRSVTG